MSSPFPVVSKEPWVNSVRTLFTRTPCPTSDPLFAPLRFSPMISANATLLSLNPTVAIFEILLLTTESPVPNALIPLTLEKSEVKMAIRYSSLFYLIIDLQYPRRRNTRAVDHQIGGILFKCHAGHQSIGECRRLNRLSPPIHGGDVKGIRSARQSISLIIQTVPGHTLQSRRLGAGADCFDDISCAVRYLNENLIGISPQLVIQRRLRVPVEGNGAPLHLDFFAD